MEKTKKELEKELIDRYEEIAADMESGRVAPARVIERTVDKDGNTTRRELDPVKSQTKARKAWEAKTEVAELRHNLDLSQKVFAEMLNIPLATLRKWEGTQTKPSGAAASLLKIVKAKPEVLKILEKDLVKA